MKNVKFSTVKMNAIIEKHFPRSNGVMIRRAANFIATTGETYTTETGVIAKVGQIKGITFALLLKPKEFARGEIEAITFYCDDRGSVSRRITSGQWV